MDTLTFQHGLAPFNISIENSVTMLIAVHRSNGLCPVGPTSSVLTTNLNASGAIVADGVSLTQRNADRIGSNEFATHAVSSRVAYIAKRLIHNMTCIANIGDHSCFVSVNALHRTHMLGNDTAQCLVGAHHDNLPDEWHYLSASGARQLGLQLGLTSLPRAPVVPWYASTSSVYSKL